MIDYRIYCLDGAGRINLAEELSASNDEAAIAESRQRKPNTRKCEIWQGTRLVATLSAQDLAG